MGRFFVFAILAWFAYFLVKKAMKAFFAQPDAEDQSSSDDVSSTDLIQDPECGAYFMRQRGVKGVVDGKVLHFCSEQCYDKYLKRRSRK